MDMQRSRYAAEAMARSMKGELGLEAAVDCALAVHNPATPIGKFLRDDNTWQNPPAGGIPPTGTGFRHITAGTEDPAAKLVENADVAPAAAIAESKLALGYPTHAEDHDNTHHTTEFAADADLDIVAAALLAHGGDTGNPHVVTAAQAGAEPANANIQAHVTGTGSPHTAAGVGAEAAGAVATHAAIPGAHHAAFVQSDHDALPNPHHSNALDHNGGTQDTAIAARVQVAGQIGGTAASPDVRGIRETSGPTLLTLAGVADGQYLKRNGATIDGGNPGGGATPAWKGAIAAAWKDGDPHWVLDSMLHNPVHATPTNISITVARCAFFKLDTALTVQKIRWFGVGATTGLYRVAIYRVSDGAQMAVLNDFNTAAQTWGSGAFACTLAAGVLYLLAVSVDTTGTTAGVACHSGTTGRIGVIPTNWPGNLDINAASPKIDSMGFCQFAVTAGALPATLPTLVLQAAWTGGMPAFFLDNNNA